MSPTRWVLYIDSRSWQESVELHDTELEAYESLAEVYEVDLAQAPTDERERIDWITQTVAPEVTRFAVMAADEQSAGELNPVDHMRACIALLKQARDHATSAEAPRTLGRIRVALTSAGGALRHAGNRQYRKER